MRLSTPQRKLLAQVVKAAPIVLTFGGRYGATIRALDKRGLVEANWSREPRISTGHKWVIECIPTAAGRAALVTFHRNEEG